MTKFSGIAVVFYMYILMTVTISKAVGYKPHATCKITYEKVGCFKDKPARALPIEMINDRDETSLNYKGYRFKWAEYKQSVHSLACRCAAEARKRGYKVFGLQFFAECWSGPGGEATYNKYGKAKDENCYQNITNPDNTKCDKGKEQECVGGQFTNYVYKLKESCIKALDVGIIIDESSSETAPHFKTGINFIKTLMKHFSVSREGTHFGVIKYSTNAHLEFKMSDDRYYSYENLAKRMDDITFDGGNTYTDRALEMASNELFTTSGGDRPDKPNVLIVFTDGKTNIKSKPWLEVLAPLHRKNVHIIAVGIGNEVDMAELKLITYFDQRYAIHVDNFDSLSEKLDVILDHACQGKKR